MYYYTTILSNYRSLRRVQLSVFRDFSISFFADFFLPFDKDFLWMFSRQLSFPFNWDKENGTMQISPDTIRLSSIFQLFMNSNNSFTIPVLKYFVTTPAVKGKVS